MTREMVVLLSVMIAAMTSFYLLLSVVPLYAVRGGAGPEVAGLCTGAMMFSTVLLELKVPGLVARYGYRSVMALGLFLLGAPALVLLAGPALLIVLGVSLARGAGLGIAVVLGTALAAEVIPADRRGEGLGVYGVAVGVPAVISLPLGVWLSAHVGFRPPFLLAAAIALAALSVLPAVPSRRARLGSHGGVLAGLGNGALARPTLIFAAVTFAAGVLVTFLPLAVLASERQLAALALLVQACTAPPTRWIAGRLGDRYGSQPLLVPAVIASALGVAGLIEIHNTAFVVAGAALFGIGFGLAQNVTLTVMFERVSAPEYGRVSALWNLAYDAGLGIGAVSFGALAASIGYPRGFAITALVLTAALLPAWRDRSRRTHA